VEELVSTNEGYRQLGREATYTNPNSSTMSQKSTPIRRKSRRSGMEMKKTPIGSSNDGGDKDLIKKNHKKSHTVYTSAKRKKDT